MNSIADRMAGMAHGAESEPEPHDGASAGGHYQIHPHEDGSAHSVTPDGEKMDHPSMHHAAAHVLGHHHGADGGKHSVVHHHDGTSEGGHSMSHHDGEQVSGPHDTQNLEDLKNNMGKFLDEESHEYGGGGMPSHGGGHEKLM